MVLFKILLVAVLLSFPGISAAGKVMYKWVDEEGVVHFADRPDSVPEKYRKHAEKQTMTQSMAEVKRETEPSAAKDDKSAEKKDQRKEWWLAQKKYRQDEVARLKKQVDQNNKDTELLRQGRVRQGERTNEGIVLGQGPLINDYRELRRLKEITATLEEELKKAQYMLNEGLIQSAYREGVSSELIKELQKK
ncbi:MAG: DUF4124 domain-containing protein [Pseudomonadota bacterium]